MRVWALVIIGAAIPLVLGVALGSITTESGEGTWGYPMVPSAFLLMGIGLALSHLLVGVGYREVARIGVPRGTGFGWLAFAGSVVLAACEVWSGLSAEVPLGSPSLTALDAGYVISGAMVVIGSLGAGIVLLPSRRSLSLSLIVVGVVLACAMLLKYLVADSAGILALTIWSLLYIWVALGIRSLSRAASLPRASVPAT